VLPFAEKKLLRIAVNLYFNSYKFFFLNIEVYMIINLKIRRINQDIYIYIYIYKKRREKRPEIEKDPAGHMTKEFFFIFLFKNKNS
jgi:hypothetical protein